MRCGVRPGQFARCRQESISLRQLLRSTFARAEWCSGRDPKLPRPNDQGDAPIYLVRTQSFDDYLRESGTEDDKRQVRTSWCIPRGSAVPGRSASSVLGFCDLREVHLATLLNKSSAALAVNKRQTMDHLTFEDKVRPAGNLPSAAFTCSLPKQ
jgi:hypothetical protein